MDEKQLKCGGIIRDEKIWIYKGKWMSKIWIYKGKWMSKVWIYKGKLMDDG